MRSVGKLVFYGIIALVGGISLTAQSWSLDIPLQAKTGGPVLAGIGLALLWLAYRLGRHGLPHRSGNGAI